MYKYHFYYNIIALLEDNPEEQLYNLEIREIFLSETEIPEEIKEKNIDLTT